MLAQPTKQELRMKAIKRLGQLSRAPGQCPVANCTECVFPSGLMSHLRNSHTTTHTKSPSLVFRNVYERKPLRMELPDLRGFDERDVPHCIGVLQFGGEYNNSKSAPGHHYLFVPNTDLSQDDQKYENYLPMAVMVSKSTWHDTTPCSKEFLPNETEGSSVDGSEIFVIWLASPITVKPFYYTMTVFNGSAQHSISVVRKSRNFVDSQVPRQFLSDDTDYMILRGSDVQLLLDMPKEKGDKEPAIQMEIIVHELHNGFPTNQLGEDTSSSEESSAEEMAVPIIYKTEKNTKKVHFSHDHTSLPTDGEEDGPSSHTPTKSGKAATKEKATTESDPATAPKIATESQAAAEGNAAAGSKAKTIKKTTSGPLTESETDTELKVVDTLLERLCCIDNSGSSDPLSDSSSIPTVTDSRTETRPKTAMAAEPMQKPDSETDSDPEVDALLERLGYQTSSDSSDTSPMPSGLSSLTSTSSSSSI